FDSANKLLYAGGDFSTAGGVPVNSIAVWNGTAWSAVGTVVASGNDVYALVCDSFGNLYMGGYFGQAGGVPVNNIALWNGSSPTPAWSALGAGMNGEVRALALDGAGNLCAGGYFTTAGIV